MVVTFNSLSGTAKNEEDFYTPSLSVLVFTLRADPAKLDTKFQIRFIYAFDLLEGIVSDFLLYILCISLSLSPFALDFSLFMIISIVRACTCIQRIARKYTYTKYKMSFSAIH